MSVRIDFGVYEFSFKKITTTPILCLETYRYRFFENKFFGFLLWSKF